MLEQRHPNAIKMGTLTKIAGVSDQTVRHYERLGLVSSLGRTQGGFRLFDPAVVLRIHFIRAAQAMGFSLDAIRQLLKEKFEGDEACQVARRVLADQLAELERQIEALTQRRALLLQFSGTCLRCQGPCLLEHELNVLTEDPALSKRDSS
jgi:DNA-binding transcriptional MerR regulator